MSDETGTQKISLEDLKGGKKPKPEEQADLTGEEIDRIADLFADAPDEKEEDTGEFEPVKEDTDQVE